MSWRNCGSQAVGALFFAFLAIAYYAPLFVYPFTAVSRSKQGIVQQKVNDADIQYPPIIIPTLVNIVTNNDFGEGISGQRKWPVFNFCLFFRGKSVSRLNIGFLSAESRNKIKFIEIFASIRPKFSIAILLYAKKPERITKAKDSFWNF